jgi:enterochelin esterase-like enzyme
MKSSLLRAFAALLLCGAAVAEPVRFSLAAPEARAVFLAGEMTDWDAHKRAMTRGEDGVWRLDLDLTPGEWLYKFVVDGRWMHDPATLEHDADGRGGQHSYRFVGQGGWTVPEGAPRGRVESATVPSKALKAAVKVNVYLPPGFAKGQALPVLWLLHGGGMDADQWWRTGHIERYLDRAIAVGEIRPMVVVMPSSQGQRWAGAAGVFVVQELPAWLAQRYGLHPEPRQSALAGMSMGGQGAVSLPLRFKARWGFAYALSGYYPPELIEALRTGRERPTTPTVLRCGREDELVAGNRALVEALTLQGQAVDYREDAGGHSFHYWSQVVPEMLRGVDGYFRNGLRPPGPAPAAPGSAPR